MKLRQFRFTVMCLLCVFVTNFMSLYVANAQAQGDTLPATLVAASQTQDESLTDPSQAPEDTDKKNRNTQDDRDEDGTDDGRYDYRSDDGGGYYD